MKDSLGIDLDTTTLTKHIPENSYKAIQKPPRDQGIRSYSVTFLLAAFYP